MYLKQKKKENSKTTKFILLQMNQQIRLQTQSRQKSSKKQTKISNFKQSKKKKKLKQPIKKVKHPKSTPFAH